MTDTDTERVLISHDMFEQRHPDERDAQLLYENHRRATHIAKHGNLDGYRPGRAFPCPGDLRVFGETAVHLLLHCDACGYETSCRVDDPSLNAIAF